MCSLTHVQVTAPWTVACQAPLYMEFSRQEYWSRVPFPSPGDLPNPRIELESLVPPALQEIVYHCTTWKGLLTERKKTKLQNCSSLFLTTKFINLIKFSLILASLSHRQNYFPTNTPQLFIFILWKANEIMSVFFKFSCSSMAMSKSYPKPVLIKKLFLFSWKWNILAKAS